jgi:peptidoglycan/LPS O-acetylase OafA/YrhL
MIQNMKKRDRKAFFVVGMIMTTLITFIPLLGVEFRVKYFFVGHILLFCLGSMIEEIFESEKSRKILYIIGPVAELINVFLITVLHYSNGYKETSPLYIIFAISLFLIIKNVVKIPAKSEKLILFLGKHSLAVYMTHCMVIYTLRDLTNLPHGVGSFMLASIMVLAISELIGFVIDSTIIKWLQNLTIKIFKLEKVLK